jgi:FtsH-binding integral membrane protein
MANWNDPRPDLSGIGASPFSGQATGSGSYVTDQGLRRYMLSIYNYMASGVLLSGIVALLTVKLGLFSSGLALLAMLGTVAIAMVTGFGFNRLSEAAMKGLFWAYAVAMGYGLSIYLMIYTGASVSAAFFAAAASFAGLSLVGYTTKKDLSAMGAFLWMGLIGIIVASVINIFLQSSGLALAVTYISVVVFAGLTAWHTQSLKQQYYMVRGSGEEGKVATYGALVLYTDFINLFLSLLRILGDRR